MAPRYRLLVTDIDGTLVNSGWEMSPENAAAIRQARENGVQVVLCSGRSPKLVRRYIEELDLDGYHIYCDGALVQHSGTGEVLYAEALEAGLVREIISYARRNRAYLEVYTTAASYAELPNPSPGIKADATPLDDLTTLLEKESIIQTSFIGVDGAGEALADGFISMFSGRAQVVRLTFPSTPGLTFAVSYSPAISKGNAVTILAEHLGVPIAETLAIGDNINDVSMIKTAGLGVAMGNAVDELKEAADHIAPSIEEHGLADTIRRFLL